MKYCHLKNTTGCSLSKLLFSVLSFVVDAMQSVEQTQIRAVRVRTRDWCDLNVPDISLSKCKNGVKV